MSEDHVSYGPVATLPGALSDAQNKMCDEHHDVPALHRVQGETDSFGCEYHFMCRDCYDEYKRYVAEDRASVKTCEWCREQTTDVRPYRDYEEGSSGRLYNVCPSCRAKHYAALFDDSLQDDFYDF